MTVGDEWDDALAESQQTGAGEGDDEHPQPRYSSVEEFVTDYLAPLITQDLRKDDCWCPEWWRHPEGIARLEALWRSWEQLRRDGTTGMSVWLRDHRDPHMAFLMNRLMSPFVYCSPKKGHQEGPAPLRVEPAPADWWGTEDDAGGEQAE